MISYFRLTKSHQPCTAFSLYHTILKIASLILFFVSLKFESVRRCFWCGQTCSEYFPRLPRISCRLMPSAYCKRPPAHPVSEADLLFLFPIWLCRTASYLRSDKDTYKRELSKTKLALILFCRAEVFSSFNSKIVKVKCRGKRKSYFQLCHSTLTFHKYNE